MASSTVASKFVVKPLIESTMKILSNKKFSKNFWLIITFMLPGYSIAFLYYLSVANHGMSMVYGIGLFVSLPALLASELRYKKAYHFELGSFILSSISLALLPTDTNILFVLTSINIYVLLRALYTYFFTKEKQVMYYVYAVVVLNLVLGTYFSFYSNQHEFTGLNEGISNCLHFFTVSSLSLLMAHTLHARAKRTDTKLRMSNDEVLWYSNLFNIASHNLRGPLTSITSNIDLISLKLPKGEMDKIQDHFDRICLAEGQLQRVINQWVNPGRLVHNNRFCENLMAFANGIESVELVLPSQPIVMTKSNQTAIILGLEVFIDNAIEHGNASKIKVDVSGYPEIVIQDNGHGMQKEKLKQFGKPQPSKKGNGLGTYFAKNVLEQIGLSVEVESSVGEGTRISLTPAMAE